PTRPDAADLPALRGEEARRSPDGLRGLARACDRALRRRPHDGGVPRAVRRLRGRRVPGRQPAPADAARPVGGTARRPLCRRRRLPVDLRLHRRDAGVPARLPGAGAGLPARGELPLDATGARAREPARAEAGRSGEGARGDASRRPRAGGAALRDRGRGRLVPRRADPCRRLRARGDRDPLPYACTARGLPGRASRTPEPPQGAALLTREAARRLLRALNDEAPAADRVRAIALELGWLPARPSDEKLGEREETRQSDLDRLVRLVEEVGGTGADFKAEVDR